MSVLTTIWDTCFLFVLHSTCHIPCHVAVLITPHEKYKLQNSVRSPRFLATSSSDSLNYHEQNIITLSLRDSKSSQRGKWRLQSYGICRRVNWYFVTELSRKFDACLLNVVKRNSSSTEFFLFEYPEDGVSEVLQHVSNKPPIITVSHSRTL